MSKGTQVYGSSDDLVEVEGDISGEVGFYESGSDRRGILLAFDDGTVLQVYYGKGNLGVWGINVLREGELFDRVEVCVDEDADRYSDTVYLKPGLTKAWAGGNFEPVE